MPLDLPLDPAWLEALGRFTWLDWTLLLLLALFVIGGPRRGLVLGALDLLGSLVALGVALLGYRPLADLVVQRAPEAPAPLVYAGAFVGLLLLAQVVYAAAVGVVLARLLRPLFALAPPLAGLDRALGVLPGAAKGLLTLAVLLLPLSVLPFAADLSGAIERSVLGSRLVAETQRLAPEVGSRLGRVVGDALPGGLPPAWTTLLPGGGAGGVPLLAPPRPAAGEVQNIDFGPLGTLAPDPEAEERMLVLVNEARLRAGLRPLRADEALRAVARAHSEEMFRRGYFSHTSPVTGSPFDRMRAAGIPFLAAGENLALAPNVQVAHDGLMGSPGHRANILRPEFGRVGIGAVTSQLRGTMFTQAFAD